MAGIDGTERGRGRADGDDGNRGGDPLREAFNRLGSIIDFQAQQQVTCCVVGGVQLQTRATAVMHLVLLGLFARALSRA